MRAWVLTSVGSPPVLADVAAPAPAPDEVVVHVAASSVNPHDVMVAGGAAARYLTYDLPAVVGTDLSGTVVEAGAAVTDLGPGDRVFGLVRELTVHRGAFAELVNVPREWLARTPDRVDDSFAGTLGLAGLTALRCVEAIQPSAGETVFVNGATGGVGTYLCQILVSRGARVMASASGEDADTHVTGLGVDATVDWRAPDLGSRVKDWAPGGVDAMVDVVTRDATALSALATEMLAASGRLTSTCHAAVASTLPGHPVSNVVTAVDARAIAHLATLAGDGVLRPSICRTFEFSDVPQALNGLAGGVLGKIAVSGPVGSSS